MFFQIRSYAIKEGGCIPPQSFGERIWVKTIYDASVLVRNYMHNDTIAPSLEEAKA